MPDYVITPKRGDKVELQQATNKELASALKKFRVTHNPVLSLTVKTGPRG